MTDRALELLDVANKLITLALSEINGGRIPVQSAPTPPPPTNLERVRKRLPSKQALFDLGDVVQIVDYSKDLYSESFRIRSVHWNEVSDRWFYTGDLGTFSEASLKLYQRGGQPAVGASE